MCPTMDAPEPGNVQVTRLVGAPARQRIQRIQHIQRVQRGTMYSRSSARRPFAMRITVTIEKKSGSPEA